MTSEKDKTEKTGKQTKEELVADLADFTKQRDELWKANMPQFERGIAEASVERENALWKELAVVFKKNKIMPDVSVVLVSDVVTVSNASGNVHPGLTCAGVKVTVVYIVAPVDKKGKSGQFASGIFDELNRLNKVIVCVQKELDVVAKDDKGDEVKSVA